MTFLSDFLPSVLFPNTTLCVRVCAGRSRCVWNGRKTSPNCVALRHGLHCWRTVDNQSQRDARVTSQSRKLFFFFTVTTLRLVFHVFFISQSITVFCFYKYQLNSCSFHGVLLKENVLNTVTNAALFLTHSTCPLISLRLSRHSFILHAVEAIEQKHTRTCTHFGVHGSYVNTSVRPYRTPGLLFLHLRIVSVEIFSPLSRTQVVICCLLSVMLEVLINICILSFFFILFYLPKVCRSKTSLGICLYTMSLWPLFSRRHANANLCII